MRLKKALFLLMVALAFSAVPGLTAWGGEGTFTSGTPNQIDLNVLFMYDEACFHANPIKCPDWETLFKEGSKLLYDATQKQVKIGKIKFFNACPNAVSKADVQINNDNQGADAHVGGIGKNATRIRLSQTHKTVTTGAGAGNRGQFGLVHEMGHYVFALLDEYLDKTGANTADAYCIDQNGTTATIMDGGTTVSPNNRRTEFCTSANHRAGHTEQDTKRTVGGVDYEDSDGWNFLAAYVKDRYAITLTVPAATPTSSTAAVDPAFEYYSCGIRAVTCIDHSGSMAGTKLTMAKAGARSFINLSVDTDQLAVTSYDDVASTNFPLALMTPANKLSAKAQISGITDSGTTNIGGGLQVSLAQITGAGAPVSNEVIVLLSDGQHNTGTAPSAVLPSILSRGAKVYTIGIGDADSALMSSIAASTGGSYYFANSSFALKGHFAQVIANLRNNGLIQRIDNKVVTNPANPLAAVLTSYPVYVDSFVGSSGVTFFLTWDDPAVELGLEIKRPDGTVVQSSDPGVSYFYDASNADKYFKISSPVVGAWTATVSFSGTATPEYSFQVHSGASNLSVGAWPTKATYTYPERPLIKASATYNYSIAGAQVRAKVVRPNGTAAFLTLHDDGDNNHGDERANDGIYSNYFDQFYGDGSYSVSVTVDNQNGQTNAYPEKGGTFTSTPVANFTREVSMGFAVTGGAPQRVGGVFLPIVLGGQGDTPPTTQTCQGHCGGAGVGGCWCDSLCATYGDCCPDYSQYCVIKTQREKK